MRQVSTGTCYPERRAHIVLKEDTRKYLSEDPHCTGQMTGYDCTEQRKHVPARHANITHMHSSAEDR
jgi:hypothetical protein